MRHHFAVLNSLGGRFCNKTLIGHEDWVRSVIATADGKTLASCSNDQTIRLWDVGSGKCTAVLRGHTHVVETICYATEAAQTAMTAHGLRVCRPDCCYCCAEGCRRVRMRRTALVRRVVLLLEVYWPQEQETRLSGYGTRPLSNAFMSW